jgi:hydroxymethylglutaryl-CoA lyase
MQNKKTKIVECPRDAMQGLHHFISTKDKINYINLLLSMGFDTIDFGSFVSPKAIPQMKDTAEVLKAMDLSTTRSKLLAIVANERGARDACAFEQIDYLGYPFSISEEFQKRNTNSTIEESLHRVEVIQKLCKKNQKQLVIYISMAFGNPYEEPWHPDIATHWALRLNKELEVDIIALSDTIGAASPAQISDSFKTLLPELPNVEVGAHLHTTPQHWEQKVESAYKAGCRRFDGAIRGYGGCPMAMDELTGNMPTEMLIAYLEKQGTIDPFDEGLLQKAIEQASQLMG